MSDKPTTGEWMASTVEVMIAANGLNAHYAIAKAHNAALAAERKEINDAYTDWNQIHDEVKQLREQLAAEREQGVKALAGRSFELHTAVEALKEIWVQTLDEDAHRIADAALEKIGGGKST